MESDLLLYIGLNQSYITVGENRSGGTGMLRISRELEYAVITMKALAEANRIVSSRELADRYAIPLDLLRKVLQRLAQAGLAGVVQGSRGGYYMIRGLEDVSMGELAEAVIGRLGVAACLDENGGCSQESACVIRDNMTAFQNLWIGLLNSISLRDFTDGSRDWKITVS